MKHALILHGWPQYQIDKYFLSNYLRKLGYTVITPNMFSSEYVFNPKNVLSIVKTKLNNSNLDLIVGISLGGLILPFIADKYPKAKIIFISSGSKLKTKSVYFNIFEKLIRLLFVFNIASLLVKMPDSIIIFFYKLANPFKGKLNSRKLYDMDMHQNIKYIKNIPISKEKEILKFVLNVDNSIILKKLQNKSLIFSGKSDLLMDENQGKQLNKLLSKSKLILNKGSHFNSFSINDLEEVNKFLK